MIGPDYVGDVSAGGDHLVFQTERRGTGAVTPKASLILDAEPAIPLHAVAPFQAVKPSARVPALGAWSLASGAPEAQPGYADTTWKPSANPLPMGADSDQSAYAWYRTVVHSPGRGTFGLSLADAGDWVSAFVNGVHADTSPVPAAPERPGRAEL